MGSIYVAIFFSKLFFSTFSRQTTASTCILRNVICRDKLFEKIFSLGGVCGRHLGEARCWLSLTPLVCNYDISLSARIHEAPHFGKHEEFILRLFTVCRPTTWLKLYRTAMLQWRTGFLSTLPRLHLTPTRRTSLPRSTNHIQRKLVSPSWDLAVGYSA